MLEANAATQELDSNRKRTKPESPRMVPQPPVEPQQPRPADRAIEAALKDWVWTKLDPGATGEDVDERRSAMMEVGQLLITEQSKYPTEAEMREEISDLVIQLGGEAILDSFIQFLVQLRRAPPAPHFMPHGSPMRGHMMPPPHHNHMPFPFPPAFDPHTGMPLYPYPHHFPGFFPPPPPPPPVQRQGNMVLSRSGEPTAVQKLKEREAKRRELLQTFTEELKGLLAKAAESDGPNREKYLDLIEGVKKKIAGLSAAAPSQKSASQRPQGIVGFYGNQYINPQRQQPTEEQQGK